MRKQQTGLSLLELMVGITIVGVLLGMAVPSFREFSRGNRITAAQNDLATTVNYARSEALKRSLPVALCASEDGETCSDSLSWAGGWLVFVNRTPPANLIDANDEIINVTPALIAEIGLTADVTNIEFLPTGMTSGAATFALNPTVCSDRHARQFVVSITGSASTTKVDCP
jgi:type IV fimbrial biogenesis protein FimT